MTLRLWRDAEAAPRRPSAWRGLRDAGAAAGAGARAHGAARHQGRPPDPVAHVGRLRADAGPARGRRSTSSPARSFNVGSPKQLGDILFGKFGLPGGKKTKTGAWATGATLLDDLAAGRPRSCRSSILEWRQLSKLKSTYTDALPTYVHPRDRPRPHLLCARRHHRPAGCPRPSPNLQNIPIRTEEGRRDPHAPSSPTPGIKLISADYSPDRAAAARPHRRHPAAAAGLRRRASTSTP